MGKKIIDLVDTDINSKIKATYELYGDKLFRFCLFKTNNVEKAEDVVSATFVKYIENMRNIDETKAQAWLFSSARNYIIDQYYRKNSKFTGGDSMINLVSLENNSTDIEDHILTEELVMAVKTELETFEQDVQDIVSMKVWEEMDFKEIAETFDSKTRYCEAKIS